jgi:hypothetical protein
VPSEDSEKDFNSGERYLPPLYARVFVIIPSGTYDDCFVLCSGFSTIDSTQPFMEDEKEKIRERIAPNGWHTIEDLTTGTYETISPDKKTSLLLDYGTEDSPKEKPELHLNLFDEIKADVVSDEKAFLSLFDEVSVEHQKGDNIKINAYDTEIIVKQGDVQVKTTKKTITTEDIDIKSTAPIGLNDGLFSTGLDPYFNSETAALEALRNAALAASAQLSVLDGFSGGAGTITALGTAIVTFCNAMKTADGTAQQSIAKVAK